jgi:predicted GNAT family N-acyltransferase/RimJ/RimL family protein N-acetyltransferase
VTAATLDVSGPRDEAERRAAARVRHEVFVVGQGVPAGLEADGLDASADHVVARLGGVVVGTGRLVDGPGPGEARVQRMAVLPAARGRGVGLGLLRALEARARQRGAAAVVLSAQLTARGFYAWAGYTARGAEFTEAGIRHVSMRRALPVLRELGEGDSEALVRLIGGCFAEYPGCVLDLDVLDRWMLAPRASYDAWGGRMWVVELDGEVAACCGVKPLGGAPGEVDTVELKTLYVAAPARRRGIASELVALAEAQAREWGAQRVELWSDTRFLDAHRLYEGLGYRRLPETRELHDPSDTTEYAFAKDLPA